MADVLVSASYLTKILGLPEDALVYNCVREYGGIFRFKVTGPMSPEKSADEEVEPGE